MRTTSAIKLRCAGLTRANPHFGQNMTKVSDFEWNHEDSPLWVDSLYKQYSERWGITEEEVRKKYEAQVPLGRGTSYDDVTNVVVFLASNQSSYMTGPAVNVTGGQVMSP